MESDAIPEGDVACNVICVDNFMATVCAEIIKKMAMFEGMLVARQQAALAMH